MPIDTAHFDLKHIIVRHCTLNHSPSYSSVNITLINDSESTEVVTFPMKVPNVSSNKELCVIVSAVSKCLQEGVPSPSTNISELKFGERQGIWQILFPVVC